MDINLLLIIIFISFLQSIFGVGILLFGTPILLYLDYSFIHTLNILLPLSLLVNLVQLYSSYKAVDYKFYFTFLKYSIPFVFLSLFLIIKIEINMNLLIGLLVILVFFQNKTPYFKNTIIKLIDDRIVLIILGIVHGLTNLGGSLLTTIIYSKEMNKDNTRSTIVICYATLAIIQLITLSFVLKEFYFTNIFVYCLLSFLTVVFTEKFLYHRINSKNYKSIFEVFLLFMGLFLIFK